MSQGRNVWSHIGGRKKLQLATSLPATLGTCPILHYSSLQEGSALFFWLQWAMTFLLESEFQLKMKPVNGPDKYSS